MKSEWKECQLGDLITFQRGYDLPKTKMCDGEYPVVGSNGIIGYHNEYTTEAPSITVGRSGNVGTPFLYNGKSWSHNTSLYIKEFKDVYPLFIYYFLKTLDLKNYAGGSAVPTLNRNHIHSLNVSIPVDIDIQKKISSVLSALDDKIELNNRMNENLEQQAQAIFKSWFVDFEPFGGVMPDDWYISNLGQISDISSGKRPNKKQNLKDNEFNIPLVGASCVMGYTNKYNYDKKILVTGRVGTHGVVQRFNSPCWASDNTLVIQSLYYEYVYQILRKIDYKNLNRGSTQPLITQSDLKKTEVIIPTIKIFEDFEVTVGCLMQLWEYNRVENQRLSALRDTLLPKLMNGEIDVENVRI